MKYFHIGVFSESDNMINTEKGNADNKRDM